MTQQKYTPFIIAIDGPSASGKGTLAKGLAQALDLLYLDTGATYRLVALHVLNANGNPNSEADALAAVNSVLANFTPDQLLSPELRTEPVAQAASQVSVHAAVREKMVELQRAMAQKSASGAVLDGRDIGTVVFPDAHLKLFVTAGDETRANRRFLELQNKGIVCTYASVLNDLRERDVRDSTRTATPLVMADDAILFDTDTTDAATALKQALELAKTVRHKNA